MATLLLADDSMTTQKVVSLTFADEGVEVLTAADGDTAVRLFHERRPDIVLADVNIPGLNGYEICEEIRKTSDLTETPVVLLVGSFEPFDANEAHRVGANDYLTKPFSSIRRLVATVLAFLDDQPSTEEPHASVSEQVQEISVEPPQEGVIETRSDEPIFPTAEYDNAELAPEIETVAETPLDEGPVPDAPPATLESSSESLSDVAPAFDPAPTHPEEPDFKATNDIEELYSQSFAETVEMPHTLAERARFSDVSSDDGLIEAQFTEHAADEQSQAFDQEIVDEQVHGPHDQEQVSTESAWAENSAASQENIVESLPADPEQLFEQPTEQPAEPHAESTNGYATWSEPPAVEDSQPATFEQRPHDAPTERLTPQNATTEEYNFEFRGEEAFFEPTPEPLTDPYAPRPDEEASVDERGTQMGPETPTPVQDQPPVETASTPWESVASPSEGGVSFDDRNLLEIPGQSDVLNDRPDLHGGANLSMETVEHIARIVASQMSEQIIREIAERVVPMVVQQTLANKRDESGS